MAECDPTTPNAKVCKLPLAQFVTVIHGARNFVAPQRSRGYPLRPAADGLRAAIRPYTALGSSHITSGRVTGRPEMGPRVLVLALLPTAAAALRYNDKGTELGPILGGSAAVLIFMRDHLHVVQVRVALHDRPRRRPGRRACSSTRPRRRRRSAGLAALSSLRGEVQVGWKLERRSTTPTCRR